MWMKLLKFYEQFWQGKEVGKSLPINAEVLFSFCKFLTSGFFTWIRVGYVMHSF